MSRLKAWLIGFGIFFYFVLTTAWLPSRILLGPLSTSGRFVQDLATVVVWGFFLVLGMWALRRGQAKGII